MSDPSSGLVGSPIVGVLGGMGPQATVDFMGKLVGATPVQREKDHLRVAVWSDPTIPDRTEAILGRGPSPVPAMQAGVKKLTGMGARLIAIPCNTAHVFVTELNVPYDVEVLDMIAITVDRVKASRPKISHVGVLETTGTRQSGIYRVGLEERGLIPVSVSQASQIDLVDAAISLTKLGREHHSAERLIRSATQELIERGAQTVIAGCTEVPLISCLAARLIPIIDSTQCLADEVVQRVRALTPRKVTS